MGSISGKAIYILDDDGNNGTSAQGGEERKNRLGIQRRNVLRTECVCPGMFSFLLAMLSPH